MSAVFKAWGGALPRTLSEVSSKSSVAMSTGMTFKTMGDASMGTLSGAFIEAMRKSS